MPSLRELMIQKLEAGHEAKNKVENLPEKEDQKIIDDLDSVKKIVKKQVKNAPKTEDQKGIEITSDNIRTAFYLINNHSSRGSIQDIFNELREFLNTHEIKEKAFRKYEIVKKI